jgi:Protein of unknown function (DUF2905)
MTGRVLILAGLLLLVLGVLLTLAPGLFAWFGHLPGDIRRQGEHGTLFIPVTSMIIVSIVISLVINLWFRR